MKARRSIGVRGSNGCVGDFAIEAGDGRPIAAAARCRLVRRLHHVAERRQPLQTKDPPLRAMRDLDRDARRHQRVEDADRLFTAIPRTRVSVVAESIGAAACDASAGVEPDMVMHAA